ncbi:hypothetical protein QAD02_002333 [Eretmocerus hayati]|uniref:Uncharacterized protein n=1 Tax=Eretmocerus hayati TaxID=131215 RepID=A0ACC2NL81_9HYME|nr:hypothetical protein QAD02_002333 [Eretmocerus hayati]
MLCVIRFIDNFRLKSCDRYFNESTEVVRDIVQAARDIGGGGFVDMNESDISELVHPYDEQLTAEEVDVMISEPTGLEESHDVEIEDVAISSATVVRIMKLGQDMIEEAISNDPIMTRGLRLQYGLQLLLAEYEELFRDIKRRAKQ